MVYMVPEKNNSIGFAMLVDSKFECKMKIRASACYAIVVKNLQRTLVLKCKSIYQQREWFEKITSMANCPQASVFREAQYLSNGSYAPVRRNQKAGWYVNGAKYMEHIMHALNNARDEIFIADWWLTPEIFLIRPTNDLKYRLDHILLKKANQGVKIYILLFKEV